MRRSLKRLSRASATAGLLFVAACGLLDPTLVDLEVEGTVLTETGTPIPGARVRLVRTSCDDGTCSPTTRGEALTGADGRFQIDVTRDQEEEELWALVCQEFAIDVDADGYVPLRGNYEVWRGSFCSSGAARDIEFRLDPVG